MPKTIPTPWHEDSDEVLTTGRLLVAHGHLSTPKDVLAYFEKPWKWAPEREAALKAEAPHA